MSRRCSVTAITGAKANTHVATTSAAIYVVPIFATFLSPGLPGVLLGVNPPYGAWIYVVLMNLLHVAIVAAFALRYLAVAGEVPDAPVRAAPSRERAGGRKGGR